VARTLNPETHAVRRDAFVDVAQRLIQNKGYEGFSIQDVIDEVGASKGAFYHYFGSKTALLEAIVDRFVEAALAQVARIVDDDSRNAIDKFHAYFATIARLKGEQKEFLVALMRVWFSDDNALVREKLRREQVRLVTEHIATIIRQGVNEGAFTLADPDSMARDLLRKQSTAPETATPEQWAEALARFKPEVDKEHDEALPSALSAQMRSPVQPEELEKMSAFKDFIESLDLDDFEKRTQA